MAVTNNGIKIISTAADGTQGNADAPPLTGGVGRDERNRIGDQVLDVDIGVGDEPGPGDRPQIGRE